MTIDWTRYPNFTEAEMRCRGKDCCGGKAPMDPGFMDKLQRLRDKYGKPIKVNSGYRCPKHDKSIGGAGVHPTGHAVDVSIARQDAFQFTKAALEVGMTGLGFKQHGAVRFIHADDLTTSPRPNIWSYP